ncbi:MAG: hypothetical protein ACP5GY_02075 [Vulcanisaeta sp.]
MRIAVTYDEDFNLRPLDEAEIISIINEETGELEQYENPGIGGKEVTMSAILSLSPDAIVVGRRFLCPSSYMVPHGKIKYIVTNNKTLQEVLKNLESLKKNIRGDLDEEIYAEEYKHL